VLLDRGPADLEGASFVAAVAVEGMVVGFAEDVCA
jgi:hypothetical protein